MELLVIILAFIVIVLLLKYCGKGLIMLFAILLTPFYAAYQYVSGKAGNRKHALIIAICGFIVLLCAAFIGFMARA